MFTNTLRFDHCIGEVKIVERATSSWKTFQFLTFQFYWMTNFGCILHLFAYFDLFRCLTDFFVALWQLFWKSDLFYVKVSHATNPLQAGQRRWVEFCGRESSGHLEAGVIQLHNFETLSKCQNGNKDWVSKRVGGKHEKFTTPSLEMSKFGTLRGLGGRSRLKGWKIHKVFCMDMSRRVRHISYLVLNDFACRSEKPSTSKCLNWTGWWH